MNVFFENYTIKNRYISSYLVMMFNAIHDRLLHPSLHLYHKRSIVQITNRM